MIAGEDDEIIPLPGGMGPKRVEADIAAGLVTPEAGSLPEIYSGW